MPRASWPTARTGSLGDWTFSLRRIRGGRVGRVGCLASAADLCPFTLIILGLASSLPDPPRAARYRAHETPAPTSSPPPVADVD